MAVVEPDFFGLKTVLNFFFFLSPATGSVEGGGGGGLAPPIGLKMP